MAGGTFLTQNKIRPGVYINFLSQETQNTFSERGTVLLPLALPFGPERTIVSIDKDTDVFQLLGIYEDDPSLFLLREGAKRAKKILLYRLNTGEKATATGGTLTATARFSGSYGNRFSVSVKEGDGSFTVSVLLNGKEEEKMEAVDTEGLHSAFIDFSGTLSAGSFSLSGGTDGEEDYEGFFDQAKTASFDTFALACEDTGIKEQAVSFVKEMRETEGVKIQGVLSDTQADYEGIISVKNGVILSDGTIVSKEEATVYFAAMTAAAQVNQSNTYDTYDGAAAAYGEFTGSQIEEYLKQGQIVFVGKGDRVVVEKDINTFTSFTSEKGQIFSKNRPLRVLDGLAKDIRTIFENGYIGKAHNTPDGRRLLKADILSYLRTLEDLGAVLSVEEEDISVLEGETEDSVVVELLVQPVDSMEKLYVTVVAA